MKKFDFSDFDQKQFENTKCFEQNSEMQKVLVKHALKFIPHESKHSKIDFFFYTDLKDKAETLGFDLKKMNYEVEISFQKNNQWLISGCTNEIIVNDTVIEKWAVQMCEIGFKNDCHFDGWGTLIL
jgi:hypothetical protein